MCREKERERGHSQERAGEKNHDEKHVYKRGNRRREGRTVPLQGTRVRGKLGQGEKCRTSWLAGPCPESKAVGSRVFGVQAAAGRRPGWPGGPDAEFGKGSCPTGAGIRVLHASVQMGSSFALIGFKFRTSLS